MKKQFLNLGKALSKAQQRSINGGGDELVSEDGETCMVMCNSGSQYRVPNCNGAPDGACNSTGWSICTCIS